MPLHVRFARSALDRDTVFRLRANEAPVLDTYLQSGVCLFPPPAPGESLLSVLKVPRRYDRFDAYPSTRLLVAFEGHEAVGTIRVMLAVPAVGLPHGLPQAALEDSSAPPAQAEALSMEKARPGSVAFLDEWVMGESLRSTSLPRVMLKVAAQWALARGASRLVVVAPEPFQALLVSAGFTPLPEAGLWQAASAQLRRSFMESGVGRCETLLVDEMDRTVLRRGDPLYRRGGAADNAYVVARGRVQLLARSYDGKTIPIGWVGAGELLGEEVSLSSPCRRWVDAVADAEEVDIWVIPGESLKRRLELETDVRSAFHYALTARIQALTFSGAGERLSEVAKGVVEILQDLSIRHGARDQHAPIFLSHCTPLWLSEQLGCSVEHVQEAVSILEERGMVTLRRGRVTVLQQPALAELEPSSLVPPEKSDGELSSHELLMGALQRLRQVG